MNRSTCRVVTRIGKPIGMVFYQLDDQYVATYIDQSGDVVNDICETEGQARDRIRSYSNINNTMFKRGDTFIYHR